MFDFTVRIGPADYKISTTLDTVAPTPAPGVTTSTGLQTGRLFRDGVLSTCGVQKPTPSLLDATIQKRFDGYAFETCQNSVASCVTVTVEGPTAINLFSAAYAPTFNPANIQQNYRADFGFSSNSVSYSFDLAGGKQSFAVDVHEVTAGAGIGTQYSLTVSGACGGACAPPNHPPVARAKNVTVFADNSCTASASIDNGSFDPDGDTLSITQSPAGPYPLGVTTVLLTVWDPSGATSQASADVTVVDNTPPQVTLLSVSQDSLWPPNHKMVDIEVRYNASDSCNAATCVLAVSSNQPVDGTGDGDTSPDWEVIDAHHVRLRAERAATDDDRIYTITVTCTDAAGNRTVKQVVVRVTQNR
jgi:hypothetical protein